MSTVATPLYDMMPMVDPEPIAAFWRDLQDTTKNKNNTTSERAVQRGRLTPEYLEPIASRQWKVVLSWVAFHPDQVSEFVDREGQTALHHACLFKAPANVVEAMLYAAPEMASVANDDGELALHWSVRLAAPTEVLKLLLLAYPRGAFQPDRTGQTPMSLLWVSHEDSFEIMIQQQTPHSIALREYVSKQRSWKRLMLLVQAYRGSSSDEEFFLPLHGLAACPCPQSLIRFALVVFHEDVRIRDESGNLPLAVAASGGGTNLQDLLDAYPGAVRETNSVGRLPLHLAVASDRPWNDGLQLLMKAEPRAIATRDPVTGLYPFQLAAAAHDSTTAPTAIFALLKEAPECVRFYP